jgi:pSer/pThr/pTyr-binding forkhead associated (FHA) protein
MLRSLDPGSARGPRIVLGASADCDVVIPDYSVSTRHCGFSFQPGRMVVTDLGSLNGTRVAGRILDNGESVNEAAGRAPPHTSLSTDRSAFDRFLLRAGLADGNGVHLR